MIYDYVAYGDGYDSLKENATAKALAFFAGAGPPELVNVEVGDVTDATITLDGSVIRYRGECRAYMMWVES